MAIGPITTRRTGGKTSWLGSRHGVSNAKTGTLKATAFEGKPGVTNHVVPSGYPVMLDTDGTYIPFTGTDGTKLRFSIDDRDITAGNESTAILWHGSIRTANLPLTFTPPTGPTAFVFD